jgi:hypothetical protein
MRLVVDIYDIEIKCYPRETTILPGSANPRLHTTVTKETVCKNE